MVNYNSMKDGKNTKGEKEEGEEKKEEEIIDFKN